jgi:hypothetical protein
MSHVLTKSAKGLREASGKTHELPDDLREVLALCRGQFVAEQLIDDAPAAQQEAVAKALLTLTETGYLREVAHLDMELLDEDSEGKLNYTLPELEQTDGLAHQLRADFAVRRGQRDEDSAEELRAAEEAARLRAYEKARRVAEENARVEASMRSQRELDARAHIEAEEKSRLAVLERERIEADEKSRQDAAERTRRAIEERAKREADERTRREAAEKFRHAEEQRELEAMRERLRQRHLGRRKVVGPLIAAALIVPSAVIWGLSELPQEGARASLEQRASVALASPVKISAARFVLLPRVHWQLDSVTIGEGASQVAIVRADVDAPLSALWSSAAELTHIERVHLVSPTLPLASLPALFAAQDNAKAAPLTVDELTVNELTASGLVLVARKPVTPPLTLRATMAQGRWDSVKAETALDGSTEGSAGGATGGATEGAAAKPAESLGKFSLTARQDSGAWQITSSMSKCTLPFGVGLELWNCGLKATPGVAGLSDIDFTGTVHGGTVAYRGALSWQPRWRAQGQVELRRVDGSAMAPAWFKEGLIDATGELSSEAEAEDQLFAAMDVYGRFKADAGTLNGLDLNRLVQGGSNGDQMRFERMDSGLRMSHRSLELHGLTMSSGALVTTGNVSVNADRSVRGILRAEVRLAGSRLATGVAVSGTVEKPHFQR